MSKLPILLSIPHGGTEIPPELKDRVILSSADLFDDSDAFTREIYDLGDRVSAVISTEIARAFVDVNRAPDDLPPENPDGVIKSHTCYRKVIYRKGLEPDEVLIKELLAKYYFSYHQRIQQILADKSISIELALDCHSMAAVGPAISPDRGKKRPMICLGNVYGKSCSQAVAEALAHCFRQAFSLNDDEISINRPFAGGYITRKYGGHPLPWIQVELSRALYLQLPFFDRQTFSVDKNRLWGLRQMFEEALWMFFDLYASKFRG